MDGEYLVEVTEVEWRIVPGLDVPCRVKETPGHVLVEIRPGDASRELCAQLNELHQVLMREGRWARRWGLPDEVLLRDERYRGLASARFELVPASRLLPGEICMPAADGREFVWYVSEEGDHASEAFVACMNAHWERVVYGGLWVIRHTAPAA